MITRDRLATQSLSWQALCLLFLFTPLSMATSDNAGESSDNIVQKNSWKFDVFLDDSRIGYHYFSREYIDGIEHIISEAEFDVRFMFFSVYHYRHSNHEQWRDGCLIKLESNTNDNGDEQFVKLSRSNQQNRIETTLTEVTSDGCIRSFSYWDLTQLNVSPLLNSQTGELMDVKFKKQGNETLQSQQMSIEATRYQLTGKDIEIDLWYTQDKQWLALQSTTRNGSLIRYQLKPAISQSTNNKSRLHDQEQVK